MACGPAVNRYESGSIPEGAAKSVLRWPKQGLLSPYREFDSLRTVQIRKFFLWRRKMKAEYRGP